MRDLSAWLRGRSRDQLEDLIAARPDVLRRPLARIEDLAAALSAYDSLHHCLERLDVFALQLLDVLQVLGSPTTRSALAAAVGDGASAAQVTAGLSRLEAVALAWAEGDRVRLAVPSLSVTPMPAGLGRPVEERLRLLPLSELRPVLRGLGLPEARSAGDAVRAIGRHHRDPDRLADLLAAAPPAARELLTELDDQGCRLCLPGAFGLSAGRQVGAPGWLLTRAMLVPVDWGTVEVPREVGLALRGGRVATALHPVPPPLPLSTRDPTGVDQEAGERVTRLLAALERLVEVCSRTPPALLKAGGVGVREVRRIAATLEWPEPEAAALLELAVGAGLVVPYADAVLPTEGSDEWALRPVASRWVELVAAWQAMPLPITRPPSGDGARPPAVLAPYQTRPAPHAADIRAGVLALLPTALEPGRAGRAEDLVGRLLWSAPHRYGPAEAAAPLGLAALTDADRLAVLVDGALPAPARLLLAGNLLGATRALEALLPRPVEEVTLQADLTAVVAGPAAPRLAALLDAVADRESRGAATTWRFSAASVRRALDEGRRADEMLAALAAVAPRGVPQPLGYLVADVARRHGAVRIGTAGCYLRSPDEALLAEIRNARGLSRLGLRALAPTVLAAASAPGPTLAALRAAGYAPVQEAATGEVVVEAKAGRRAPASVRRPGLPPVPAQRRARKGPDPAEVARRLAVGPDQRPEPGPVLRLVRAEGSTGARGGREADRPVGDVLAAGRRRRSAGA